MRNCVPQLRVENHHGSTTTSIPDGSRGPPHRAPPPRLLLLLQRFGRVSPVRFGSALYTLRRCYAVFGIDQRLLVSTEPRFCTGRACEKGGLSFFLAFLVLMTIFVPMVGESRPGRIAIDLTFALMLFSGAIATVEKRMLMSLIIALTILEFTADLIVEFNPSFSPRGLGHCPQGVLHGHSRGHEWSRSSG
jgi:hypothetical protein